VTKPDKIGHLTVEQLNAIDLLIGGRTDREVAETVRVTRQTECRWRQNPYFEAALNRRRREVYGVAVEKLRGLLPAAVDRLADELEGDDGLKVALKLMEQLAPSVGEWGPADAEVMLDTAARAARAVNPYGIVDWDGGPSTAQKREEALTRMLERSDSDE
jgi:hypothetical protein